jgi:hypothetical protein
MPKQILELVFAVGSVILLVSILTGQGCARPVAGVRQNADVARPPEQPIHEEAINAEKNTKVMELKF